MNPSIRKLIRSVQSEFHFLKNAKDAFYYRTRRLRGPHEAEFHALNFIPDELSGIYVDIGANHGQSIESIKMLKPKAHIVSFEANDGLAKKLQSRYRGRSDVLVRAYGLSDKNDTQTLYVPVYRKFVYDGNASLDREAATALYNSNYLYRYDESKLELKEVVCSIKRLDDEHLTPLFMKLDVQGLEYNVLLGGQETLRTHQPILMIEGLRDQPALVDMLKSIGYEEYYFDETGFSRSVPFDAINQIVMTARRAQQVTMSSRSLTEQIAPTV